MGIYLQCPEAKGKVDFLIREHKAQELVGATPLTLPEKDSGMEVVCVIDNGLFEAAGFAYSSRELQEFVFDGTSRPRRFLLVPSEECLKLNPGAKREEDWDQ